MTTRLQQPAPRSVEQPPRPEKRSTADACQLVALDTLYLPKSARTFALQMKGQAMQGAGINDGDYVILEFRDPRHGDIVAALIDGETALKRYVVHQGRSFLKSEHPAHQNLIPAQELVIQGVMIALLRLEKKLGFKMREELASC